MGAVLSIMMAALSAACLSVEIARRRRISAICGREGIGAQAKEPLPIVAAERLGRALLSLSPAAASLLTMRRTERLIDRAGFEGARLAPGFLLFQCAASIVCALALVPLSSGRFLSGPAIGAVIAAAGIEIWLMRAARRRQESLERGLPFALDMLTLCVEAGLDLAQAISRVASNGSGPISEELARTDAALRMGLRREQALRALARRVDLPAVSTMAALLAQSDRLGVGVSPVLRGVSDRARQARFNRAERRGALAAQKMLLPLVLCIMPATFVLVFGPIFVRLATGGVEALF